MASSRAGIGSVVTVLFACALTVSASEVTAAATAAAGQQPVFVDGMAQPVFSSRPSDWISQELWVSTTVDSDRDGRLDRVHIDITRPRETGTESLKVPVIYEMSPYYAGILPAANHDVDRRLYAPAPGPGVISGAYEETWVPRGFAVVHAESLGTGGSTGCPTSGGPNETAGAKAVVDWLNGRAVARNRSGQRVRAVWSTGKVGMIGTSYNGTLPNALATTGVEGLEAIASVSAISSWYDYYRAGGAVVAPGGFQGEDTDVLARAVYTRANRTICRPVIKRLSRRQDRRTGDYSRFWAARNYTDRAHRVRAAVLVAHGLRDWNVKTKHAAQWYLALRRAGVPHKIYWHQGGHGGMPPADLLNRWFSHYLYAVENGVEAGPHAYIRRAGQLTSQPEWPSPQARSVTLRLRPRRAAPTGGLALARAARHVRERITDTPGLTVTALARRPRSSHGRVYVTAPLRSRVRLSGTPVADLRVSFGQPSANVTVAVVDYTRTGQVARVVTRGWRDPQNRGALAVTRRVKTDTVYRLHVPMQPNDHVFTRGHRIGLVVMSTDADFTLRPPAGSILSLRTHQTKLKMPMVGGTDAVRRALGAD
jgi:X-Pro dipeptidyl-peptidase